MLTHQLRLGPCTKVLSTAQQFKMAVAGHVRDAVLALPGGMWAVQLCPSGENSTPSSPLWQEPCKAACSQPFGESVSSRAQACTSPLFDQRIKLSFWTKLFLILSVLKTPSRRTVFGAWLERVGNNRTYLLLHLYHHHEKNMAGLAAWSPPVWMDPPWNKDMWNETCGWKRHPGSP